VAIWRLQARYADIVTRRAWPELHEVFLPDASVHLDTVTRPPQTVTGPDAFGAFVAGAIERYDHFAFVILNTVVDVEPPAEPGGESTSATGRIFMCEVRHERDTDTWPNAHGRYEDRYEHDGERWRIAERHYRSMARQGPDGVVLGLPDLPSPERR
jgi:hypothetical protein